MAYLSEVNAASRSSTRPPNTNYSSQIQQLRMNKVERARAQEASHLNTHSLCPAPVLLSDHPFLAALQNPSPKTSKGPEIKCHSSHHSSLSSFTPVTPHRPQFFLSESLFGAKMPCVSYNSDTNWSPPRFCVMPISKTLRVLYDRHTINMLLIDKIIP